MAHSPDLVQVSDADKETAREYVLGVLDAQTRVAFEAKLAQNISLRDEVARWHAHFTALGMNIEELAPEATVLGHLKREFWGENKLPWNRRVRLWEYALGGVAAAAVAFAVFRFSDPSAAVAPLLAAEMVSVERDLKVSLVLRSDTGLLQVERSLGAAQNGQVFTLWSMDDARAPRFLTHLPDAPIGAVQLRPETLADLQSDVVLGISQESSDQTVGETPPSAMIAIGRFLDANTR